MIKKVLGRLFTKELLKKCWNESSPVFIILVFVVDLLHKQSLFIINDLYRTDLLRKLQVRFRGTRPRSAVLHARLLQSLPRGG